MNRQRVTATLALAAAVTLTACTGAPTTADLSEDASDRLVQSAGQCRDAAATQLAGFEHDPAREVVMEGCLRQTCDQLATFTMVYVPADERQATTARAWLDQRWANAGCREVAARVEAAQ